MHYQLHDNDCRHYANKLAAAMTGQQRSTAVFLRTQYRTRVQVEGAVRHLHRPLIETVQVGAAAHTHVCCVHTR